MSERDPMILWEAHLEENKDCPTADDFDRLRFLIKKSNGRVVDGEQSYEMVKSLCRIENALNQYKAETDPTWEQVRRLRLMRFRLTQDEFINHMVRVCNVDTSYAVKQWEDFSNNQLMWLTYHTHGEAIYRLMCKLLKEDYPE